ncbi:hypothetical protein Anas_00740 [Armadillidium nasatum]|uniref:Uncharacterized protein n=1 Tax=Armadillidium nasatum TaxID=96803 RepID=A0A5N5TM42_9CRUS|nr:hypothetical protein Anas_00740 [Armadillidium nasatum]
MQIITFLKAFAISELDDFRSRRVCAFQKNLVDLAELELKHSKRIKIVQLNLSSNSFIEKLSAEFTKRMTSDFVNDFGILILYISHIGRVQLILILLERLIFSECINLEKKNK